MRECEINAPALGGGGDALRWQRSIAQVALAAHLPRAARLLRGVPSMAPSAQPAMPWATCGRFRAARSALGGQKSRDRRRGPRGSTPRRGRMIQCAHAARRARATRSGSCCSWPPSHVSSELRGELLPSSSRASTSGRSCTIPRPAITTSTRPPATRRIRVPHARGRPSRSDVGQGAAGSRFGVEQPGRPGGLPGRLSQWALHSRRTWVTVSPIGGELPHPLQQPPIGYTRA